MQRIGSGAYIAEDFADGLNAERWRVWKDDPRLEVAVEDGCLRVFGRTSLPTRTSTGIITRRLYPCDVMLLAEMRVPTEMRQHGTFAFGIHLSSRLTTESQPLHPSDGGSDVVFGRFAGQVGWFHGELAAKRLPFFREREPITIIPPVGDEATVFRSVCVSYSESTHLLETAVLHGTDWVWVGQTRRVLKTFATVELRTEAEGVGIRLDVRFRNVRLFPHPTRHPVRVLLGSAGSHRNLRVVLSPLDSEGVLVEGALDEGNMALLSLPSDALFPMSGRIRVLSDDRLLDEQRVEAKGVEGIYPGDLYHALTGFFYI